MNSKLTRYGLILLLALSLSFTGCVVQNRYVWSGYDAKLYSHYKDPAQKEEFYEELKVTLDDAVASGTVPPGIYAEYGFVLYEQGKIAEAIQYYQKEAATWPESKFFMSKMIDIAQKQNKPKTTPAVLPPTAESGNKQTVSLPPEPSK